ncbi:hypothetical protein ASPWEDRAFT_26458 [Aspergillus wentii DTO 134E9]|uniref:Uncharacterized protein n=1 Tax=Aspergillus wentii DTO 134E9 TaxID=1073089 RepID=A0A1L9RQ66_ASPWE|nr:uncharacterized protein ASPWEDRAFT_26458 [Aspergillus wentii DTO 134E9]OJJ37032.1 hypothetical protein ASPWEDRAFT_26458 [Aspergillus wentii DTO 134E9]
MKDVEENSVITQCMKHGVMRMLAWRILLISQGFASFFAMRQIGPRCARWTDRNPSQVFYAAHIRAGRTDALYKPRPEVTDVQRMALEDLKDVANFFDSAMNRLRRVEMAKETSLDNSFETPSELGIFVSS